MGKSYKANSKYEKYKKNGGNKKNNGKRYEREENEKFDWRKSLDNSQD